MYKGKLRPEYGGNQVAVKVQRPGVLESVGLDVFIMRRAAVMFSKLPGVSGGQVAARCGGGAGRGV